MFIPDSEEAIKVYEQQNAIKKDASLGSYFITPAKYEELKSCEVFPGDILVSCAGTIGETYVLPTTMRKGILNQALMRIKLYMEDIQEYYLLYFDYVIKYQSAEDGKGTAMANIPPLPEFKQYLMPIPPLAEQHRISDALDKYLALIDEIEHSQTDLDALYTRLRSKILDLAVRGQLVEQDPTDEPAAELLERVREERKAFVAAGKAKAPKGGDSIIYRASDGGHYEKRGKKEECIDVPFELPEGWEWARLGSIVWHRPQIVPDRQFSYIDIGSIDNANQRLNSKETLIEAKDAPSRARKPVEAGDVLYSTVRPYLHNACLVDREFSATPIASTGFAAMVCHSGVINRYLLHALLSPYFDLYANASGNSTGSSYPAINDAALYRGLIPIPPLAEQQRIVAKIDQLQAALTNQ